jgi:hypothetical protein
MKSPLRWIGLFACSLGWHPRPFEQEPCPEGLTPEAYQFRARHRCRRCGLVGRLDVHGNLDPEGAARRDW